MTGTAIRRRSTSIRLGEDAQTVLNELVRHPGSTEMDIFGLFHAKGITHMGPHYIRDYLLRFSQPEFGLATHDLAAGTFRATDGGRLSALKSEAKALIDDADTPSDVAMAAERVYRNADSLLGQEIKRAN